MTRSILALAGLLAFAQLSSADDAVDYRLPPGIAPTSQSILLVLDPTVPDYAGRTTIELEISETVERIGVNQIGLDMSAITLKGASGSRTLAATDGDWDISWLADGAPIAPGDYSLSIEFAGKYSTDSLGMHRVTFEGNDYVFTQMEAMYARRAFPLFDEPSFKIPYTMAIEAPAGLTVIANTPVASESQDNGWQRVEFLQTQPLPSYLLAYAVGPLDRAPIEGMSVEGYVYTPKGHTDKLGFVLRETPVIVSALEEYFGSDYPYRKLDFVAVPEFAFGAMENPGLITYRTDLLLVGDEVSGATAETVLNVIAHEVAHIWYGDLVTMAWWNDLWLNEAFATWMARSTLERIYPQYDPQLKLPQAGAFGADQRTTAKPIRRTVRNNEEIFDGIGLNYSKGHAVLRMLEHYVGHDVWQEAIRAYLDEHAWSNATEQDLWAAVSEVSGLDIAKIAGDYLNQPGFATVTIDDDGNVSQKRYLTYGRDAEELEWSIPLTVKYKADGTVRQTFYLLEDESGSIDLPSDTDWVFPDAGGNGYFRWAVDLDQFYELVEDLDELSNREKIALLDNSEALLNAGDLSLADYLFVLNRLLADPYPLVFLPTLEKVKAIGDNFVDASNREQFRAFIDAALTERFAEVGAVTRADDSEALLQMRPRLMRVLGEFGSDPAVRTAAQELADAYLADPASVDDNLALEALRITAMNDDGGRYPLYRDTYLESGSANQKTNILAAIYFENPDVIHEHLDFSISDDVAAGDAVLGVNLYSAILDDRRIVFDWVDENEEAFLAKMPGYYGALLPQILGGGCSREDLEMLNAFFADRPAIYASSLAKAVETAEACISRKEQHADALAEFLAQY